MKIVINFVTFISYHLQEVRMKRLLLTSITILTAILLIQCGAMKPSLDDAHKAAEEAYDSAEGDAAKVEVLKGFLARFPDSPHTADTVDTLYYHLAYKMEDAAGFETYLNDLLEKVNDPAVKTQLNVDLVNVLASQDKIDAGGL